MNQNVNAQTDVAESFTIILVPYENESYTMNPKIPDGEEWGKTSFESFSWPMKITVNKDTSVGATFTQRGSSKQLFRTQLTSGFSLNFS